MADHGPTRGRDLKSEKRQEGSAALLGLAALLGNLANAFR